MKAMVLERYGPPDLLKLVDVATPAPGPGDVLVRVHAASINEWDYGMLLGTAFIIRVLHGVFAPRVRILGCDIAGRVEAVGDAVTSFRPGDDVYGDLSGCGFGAFAEYARAPEKTFARKPPRMTFAQAAAIPQAGMLAVQGLIDVGGIRPGRTLLLNGAGGGVGTFALQIARLYDARVTAVDKAGKLDMLRAMGAEHVIDYREADFTRQGRRYDLILDATTNRSPFDYARALEPGGAYVTVGGSIPRLLQALVASPLIARASGKRVRVVGLKQNKDLALMNELFEAGTMAPVIDGSYTLENLPEAFRRFGSGDHKGKIVVTMT